MTKIEVLKQMLEADRHNASVWYLLGVEYAEQGNRSEALQAFTQALAHGDDEMKQTIMRRWENSRLRSPNSSPHKRRRTGRNRRKRLRSRPFRPARCG